MPIDTARFSAHLRSRMLRDDLAQILMTKLDGSEQERDLSEPTNCDGLGRIRHFRRRTSKGWPANSLPIDPACDALQLGENLDQIEALVFQNSGCNWRCWYCYVPFDRLSADERSSRWVTMNELVEKYAALPKRPPVVDLSGGQPELTPEMTLWTMRALREHRLDDQCFLWSDDNLSEDYFWTKLTESERQEVIGFRNYARVGCFKGFDASSFTFNTNAEKAQFDLQFALMERYIGSGLNIYGYATFTTTEDIGIDGRMALFVDRLQEIHPSLPLRIIPLEVQVFSPTQGRLREDHRKALIVQHEAALAWNEQLVNRFSVNERLKPIQYITLS